MIESEPKPNVVVTDNGTDIRGEASHTSAEIPPPVDSRSWPIRHAFLTALFIVLFFVSIAFISQSSPVSQSAPASPSPAVPTQAKAPVTKSTNTPLPAHGFVSPTKSQLGVKTQILQGVYLTVNRPEDYISDNPETSYQPKAGNKFISVYVSFDNESTQSIGYWWANFTVVDPTGGSYYRASTLASKSPMLNSGTLNPSNRASGYIIVEVPSTMPTTEFTVHYESSFDPQAFDFK